jgi:hypothetical protein
MIHDDLRTDDRALKLRLEKQSWFLSGVQVPAPPHDEAPSSTSFPAPSTDAKKKKRERESVVTDTHTHVSHTCPSQQTHIQRPIQRSTQLLDAEYHLFYHSVTCQNINSFHLKCTCTKRKCLSIKCNASQESFLFCASQNVSFWSHIRLS